MYFGTFILVFVSSLLPSSVYGAKILMFPGPFSHFGVMSNIARALHDKGHTITLISSLGTWVKKQDHFDLWTYGEDGTELEESMNQLFADTMAGKSQFDREKMAVRQAGMVRQYEDFFKAASKFREKVIAEKFDLAIVDSFIMQSMFFLKSLNLPFMVFASGAFDPVQHARHSQSPSPLSYVPVGFTPLQMTDRMTFSQRLTNSIVYFAFQLAFKFFFYDANRHVLTYLPEVAHLSSDDIIADAELWIANTDFTLEFPRPLAPNVVYVGGLTSTSPKPLPKFLESFVSGSGDAGCIVFSLGTTVKDLEPATSQVFVDVFASLPQRVIWRYAGTRTPKVSDNVRLMKWIPQNDLLGHPKVRLFISHAGISGVMESIYHGVPMVTIPIFGDQFDVGARIVAKGLGVRVDVINTTRVSLTSAIQQVLGDSRFAATAKSMSARMTSQPLHPLNRTVHWVEYVIKHGGHHLRPASHDLNFVQYFLLDVIFCVTAVLVAVIWLLKAILCFCCRCCKKKTVKRKAD